MTCVTLEWLKGIRSPGSGCTLHTIPAFNNLDDAIPATALTVVGQCNLGAKITRFRNSIIAATEMGKFRNNSIPPMTLRSII